MTVVVVAVVVVVDYIVVVVVAVVVGCRIGYCILVAEPAASDFAA